MAYGVGITRVTPTELVARLVFNEKRLVGWYLITNQRPGPGTPLSGSAEFNKSSHRGSGAGAASICSLLLPFLAMSNLPGAEGRQRHRPGFLPLPSGR